MQLQVNVFWLCSGSTAVSHVFFKRHSSCRIILSLPVLLEGTGGALGRCVIFSVGVWRENTFAGISWWGCRYWLIGWGWLVVVRPPILIGVWSRNIQPEIIGSRVPILVLVVVCILYCVHLAPRAWLKRSHGTNLEVPALLQCE